MAKPRWIEAALPDFGIPDACPDLPAGRYDERLGQLAQRARQEGFETILVYADRERSANMHWLTGFDPRFEEALLVLAPGCKPTVLTGPENGGFARQGGASIDVVLYQPFGVLGSDRSATPALAGVLAGLGVGGGPIGVIGGKVFGPAETDGPNRWSDAPSFIVDTLREIAGSPDAVTNATGLMVNVTDGLRTRNDIDQLAVFEFGACHSSQGIRNILFGLRPGMSEFDAARLIRAAGLPVSCHPMFASGPRARLGLNSPSGRVMERGDPVAFGYGVWGGFNNRAGWLVSDPAELTPEARAIADEIIPAFFAGVAAWYGMIDIGVSGGDIDAMVRRHFAGTGITLFLNPGHLIGNEEWLNTPIGPGSDERLRSGQAIQCDMLPTVASGAFVSVMEDGVFLLDEAGRAAFAERYPAAWDRIRARRAFMEDVLGIRLAPSVLPTSNVPAYLPSFLLDPTRVLSLR